MLKLLILLEVIKLTHNLQLSTQHLITQHLITQHSALLTIQIIGSTDT